MMKLSLPPKLMMVLSFTPPLNVNVFCCRFLKNLTLCMTKLRVMVMWFSYFRDNFIV
jgi:hypothetical protein